MNERQEMILRAGNVRHVYRQNGGGEPVLHGLDLEIRRGEFVIIMGPSGCGKSTLLNILGLMMLPTAGDVEIDGVQTGRLSDAQRTRIRREKIGFVFQRFNLLRVLSAERNVAIAMKLRGDAVDHQPLQALERVGLGAKRRSRPEQMSVGEQQRVAIARAIVTRPMLLLADEPTGNLDSRNADAVLDLLADLNRSDGLTTIMITHNEHLADRADRVVEMADGRIVKERR